LCRSTLLQRAKFLHLVDRSNDFIVEVLAHLDETGEVRPVGHDVQLDVRPVGRRLDEVGVEIDLLGRRGGAEQGESQEKWGHAHETVERTPKVHSKAPARRRWATAHRRAPTRRSAARGAHRLSLGSSLPFLSAGGGGGGAFSAFLVSAGGGG